MHIIFLGGSAIKNIPKFFRILIYFFGGLLVLVGILYFLLRTPKVQTFITQKITTQLSDQLQTKLSIEGVDIDFFKKVVLEGIYLEDQQQDTLLYADRLRADIGIFALFGKEIVLDEILLENAYVNLYTIDDSATLNFAFIPEAFADTTQKDTTSVAWKFDVHDIILSNTRFNFDDRTTRMNMGLAVTELLIELETLGLDESHIKANAITIDGLDFDFHQIASRENPQDSLENESPSDTTTAAVLNPSGFEFTIKEFLIRNSAVSFVTDTTTTPGINYGNLDLKNLFLEIADIHVGENNILADIQTVSFLESNSGFKLKELALHIGLDLPSLKADLNALEINNSVLKGEITLALPNINKPDSLLSMLFLNANFDSTRIALEDISYFSPVLDSMPAIKEMIVKLNGDIKVDSGNALLEDLAVDVGKTTSLLTDAKVLGLNAIEDAYLDVNIKSFISNIGFISSFLPPNSLPPSLQDAGSISLSARAEGYLSDADLVANIKSDIGRIVANVNYKQQGESNFSTRGELNAFRVDLGTITGNDSLGLTTINSNFVADMRNGSFSADTIGITVKSLEFNKYSYEGLKLNASFVDSLLLANLRYEDENLNFDIEADANLNANSSSLKLDGEVKEANLFRLNLSPDSIIIATDIEANLDNLNIDELNGYFRLANATFVDGATKYKLDTFQLSAVTEDTIRYLTIDSDFIDAELKGRFSFKNMPVLIDNFKRHYFTSTNTTDSVSYPPDQYFALNVNIKDEPLLVKVFMPDLTLPQPSEINIYYDPDTYVLEADIDVPEVQYLDYRIKSLSLIANTQNGDNIRFGLKADNIAIGETLTIPDFVLDGSFIQDMAQFNLRIANSTEPNYMDLNGFLTNNQDTIILEILESNLAIKNDEWNIPNDAQFQYADQFLKVDNFLLTQNDQKISINTSNEFTENPMLNVEIANFEVGELLTVFDMEEYEVQGALNGRLNVTNVFTLEKVDADFAIQNLIVNEQEAGDLKIKADKGVTQDAIYANLSMDGDQNEFSLEGTYNTEDSVNTLDMELAISEFRLEQWGVFVEEFVTDLSGNIQAEMDITGSLTKPVVEGYFAFDPQSTMRIKAIGSLYRMHDEQITFSESKIDLNNFVIFDSASHELSIKGNITHDYFKDFVLDLAVETEEFKFFDAKERYSPEYYGTVNAATNITVKGPIDNLVIRGRATTKEGTDLVIALVNDPDFAAHAAFINFVNTNAFMEADSIPDTLQARSNTAEITGINMRLLLSVTQEASVQVIIDPMTGDKLVAVGEGDIRIEMSPTGEMNIQGTYVLERGSYSLSFMGLLNRQFDIREGSTINLVGDPLGAQFDIKAVYATEANLGDLMAEGTEDQYGIEQPINVVLNLEGTLESPDIGFEIEAPEMSSEFSGAAQRLKMIQDDANQLYQQVFALIVLNRFIPTDGGSGGGGGGGAAMVNQRVDASVSSILTTQLGRLTQDYLGGVELSVDLESQDANDASFENKDLQVQLSKQLFNERLTVTVGGTSSLGGSQSSVPGGDDNALMGDFEILYRINESGTLNLRIFQSNTRDIFTQEIRQRQGTSLTYVKSFDEIFVSDEDKKILRAEEEL